MECRVNKPYPKVEVERPNIDYAKLLIEDYSGIASELTSILQYVYQKFNEFDLDEEFNNTLSSIAVVEMKHLGLLGETIKLLGIEPRYIFKDKNTYKYWTSDKIDYTTNIVDMLNSDIKLEEEAIKKYKYDLNVINDEYIKRTINRIIEDEEKHIECFNMLLMKVNSI